MCGYFGLFIFAVRKCETQSSAPHPRRNSHTVESTPPLMNATSGDNSPAHKSVTCSNHKNGMALEKGHHIDVTKDNFVGVLRTQNSSLFTDSLLTDSLLSSSSFSSLCSTNDLSRQNSLCSEPQLSYRNIP